MISKRIYLVVFSLFGLGLGATCLADTNTYQQWQQYYTNLAQQAHQQQQAIVNAKVAKTQQAIQQSMTQTQNPRGQSQPTTPTAPATCNCYDQTDANNSLPSNFYYSNSGNRKARINPPCECLPHTSAPVNNPAPSVVNNPLSSTLPNNQPTSKGPPGLPSTSGRPAMSAPNNVNLPNSTNGGTGQFNIQYN